MDIWKYVYDYFTDECGLTNLIWCYAPNWSANATDDPNSTMSTTYLYPGDEYCDMIGVEGNMEITKENNYLRLTESSEKPGAITEFGVTGTIKGGTYEEQNKLYNSMDLYGNLYELTKEGYSFVYLITWYSWDIAALGKGDEFMLTDMTLGLSEVKALFDTVTFDK